jgi:YidC/Oxa1 family membrane protein insertase
MFTTLITQPITNVLVAIYQLLVSLGIPFALGFAIILLTVLIRLLLYPLISQQLRASKKMQEIQPHVNKLKEKHKNDAKRLQQETMQLYKDHGVNPLAGCIPLVIQLPIIWGLYSVLNETVRQTSYEAINKMLYTDDLKLKALWDTHFFGVPLGQDPSKLFATFGPVMFLVPVITGALQFYQSKQMMPAKPATPSVNKPKENDFASALQSQQLYVFPIMIGFFSYTLPFGLSLYWNTFTIFGIIQQYIMQRQAKVAQAQTLPSPTKPTVKKRK